MGRLGEAPQAASGLRPSRESWPWGAWVGGRQVPEAPRARKRGRCTDSQIPVLPSSGHDTVVRTSVGGWYKREARSLHILGEGGAEGGRKQGAGSWAGGTF